MTETTATETFLVIGQYYWGRGTTLKEAKKNFTDQGGRLSNGYVILTFDPETELLGVDSMGRYEYQRRDGKDEQPNPPKQEVVKPRGAK